MKNRDKITLMIVTPNLLCGGASKIISLLCKYIYKKNFAVILACINTKDAFYTIDHHQVKVVDFNKVHVRNALPQLFSLIKKEKPDIIFSNGQHLNIFLAMFKIFFNKKISFIARETSILSINNKKQNAYLFNILVKIFYPRFDKIICQSKEMANDFTKNYDIKPEKIEIISNPAMPASGSINNKNLFQDGKLKLLSIGRLSEEKGYDRLLKIVENVSVPFEYIILGDGNERKNLEKTVIDSGLRNQIHFRGNVDNAGDYLSECDILLHGAYHEGFPNVIIEAGMHGKPAIAFEEPGIGSEVIQNDFNGILIPAGDFIAFAEAIKKLSGKKLDGQKIIEATINKHGVETIIKKYEAVFYNSVKSNVACIK